MSSDLLLDPDRLAAVRATGLADTPPEEEFDRLTRIAARVLGTPISLLTLVEGQRQFFKSAHGVTVREGHIDSSLCRFVAVRAAPMVLNDAATDPQFATHRAHTELGIRSYLGFPVRSLEGHVVGSFCVADHQPRQWNADDQRLLQDLAAEAEAEVQRRERSMRGGAEHDLLLEVMRSSPAATCVLNPQGQIIYINDNAEKILGLRAEDVKRRAYNAPAWRHTTVDGRPLPDEEQPFRQVMNTGKPVVDARHSIEWPDGRRRVLSINGAPVKDAGGQIVRLVFHVQDITESLAAQDALRASEEKFSRAFRSSPDPFVITALDDGRFVEVNRGFTEVFGYTAGDAVGRTALELGLWLSAQQRSEVLRQIDRQGRLHALEVPLRHRDGRILACQLSGERFEVRGQAHLVVVVRDLTAFRAAAEAESHFRRQLQQNQKIEALGTLAGGIAHDFNNLLAGILGRTEYALNLAPDAATIRHDMEEIHRIALRARELVRRILAFNREQEAKLGPVSLAAFLRDHVELLRATLPATIEIALSLPGEDLAIDAEPGRLHQILLNLATNAAYAMQQRGRIEFVLARHTISAEFARLHPTLAAGPGARLTVRDHGAGFSPEAVSHLFEPFFTTKPPGEGTGLGLPTVHALMRLHHGTVTLEATPGGGATFQLYFPLSSARAPAAPADAPAAPLPRGRGQRILLIDDEEIVGNVASRVLARVGYKPIVFQDPRAALAMFAADPQSVDLVITDYTMPGCTGDEVVRRLLALRPDLPVIISSGHAAGLDAGKARELGARCLIEKPVSLDDLTSAVAACLPPHTE